LFSSIERIIAARNLRPKKKEGFLKVISIFSFLGIMLGVAILIIVMSVMNGFRTDLTNKILGFNSHVTINKYNNEVVDKNFINKIKNNFESEKILRSFSGEAVVMINQLAKGIMIKGLDIENTKSLKFLDKVIIEGKGSNLKQEEIILGKQLAIELNIVVDDKINLLSSAFIDTPLGSFPKQEIYTVKGIFSSGFYEFDKNVVFLTLNDTLSFFNKTKEDINLEIFLNDPLEANTVKDKIEKLNNNYNVYTWIDLNKSFFGALKVERNVMFVILTLIVIVAAFNIISGLTILIKNKTKEIAILKTLGLSNTSVVKSFFLTGFTIGLLATITGTVLGILFSINIEEVRILLSSLFNIEIFPEEIYFLDEMPSEINSLSIIIIFVFSTIITSLASIFPAIAISKMSTIKALKYE
jgi:lipoprotein-releasing system permease protein